MAQQRSKRPSLNYSWYQRSASGQIRYTVFFMGTIRLTWWDAHNNVKHSDIQRYVDGNLKNCIVSLAALAIIYTLIDSPSRNGNRIRLFDEIGFVEPKDTCQSLLFFKEDS
jgi:hypothetical protein